MNLTNALRASIIRNGFNFPLEILEPEILEPEILEPEILEPTAQVHGLTR